MEWARILAYITGTVDQQLLLRNEYLVAENRILKAQLQGRLRLSDAERARLGEIGHRLGRKALSEVATAALPETILTWYRRLVARKFDGSRAHRRPGRPPIDKEVEELIVGMAKENRSWGYDRMVGALSPRHMGRGECCAWPSAPSYVLFVTITDGKLMSRGGCRRRWRNHSQGFCHCFNFFGPAAYGALSRRSPGLHFLAVQLERRSSFGHALVGKSQDSPTMPRPGTKCAAGADGYTSPAWPR